jgi:site-specific recombinase XerD
MADTKLVGYWIPRFLRDHVLLERNLSKNTQRGYRDSLELLLFFVSKRCRKPIDSLALDDISPERVTLFLQHLEQERQCSIATRNQRLAALHAWARFVGSRHAEYLDWCNTIRNIPFKKTIQSPREHLEKDEMDALLNAPDRGTAQGLRDYAMMLFLYNTGTRADEVAHLSIDDLRLNDSEPWVHILGKGSKVRKCPLWSLTIKSLTPLIDGRAPSERVFLNRRKQPITRFGIFALVKRYTAQAGESIPSLRRKRVSPHTIRHTTACHLLKSGVDINTVRDWLGHVSLDTTNVYAQVDLEMKAKALRHTEIFDKSPRKRWKGKDGVVQFLRSL